MKLRAWPRVALGVSVLGLVLGFGSILRHPVIRDVSTCPEDPPMLAAPGISVDLSGPHSAASLQAMETFHQDLEPLLVEAREPGDLEEVIRTAFRELGWEVRASPPSRAGERLLHAVDTTRWLRFQDDVLVRLLLQGDRVRIDVRSASRVGKSDLGVNADRIRRFLRMLGGLLEGR